MAELMDLLRGVAAVPQAVGGGALDVLIGDRTNVPASEQAKRVIQAILLGGDQGQNLIPLQKINALSDATNRKAVADPQFQGAVAHLMQQGVPGEQAFQQAAQHFGVSGYAPSYSPPVPIDAPADRSGLPSPSIQQSRVPLLPPPSAEKQVKYATSQEQLRAISRPGAEGAYSLAQLAKINPDLAVQDEMLKKAVGPYERPGLTTTEHSVKNGMVSATVKDLAPGDVFFPNTDAGRHGAILAADGFNQMHIHVGSPERAAAIPDPRGGFAVHVTTDPGAATAATEGAREPFTIASENRALGRTLGTEGRANEQRLLEEGRGQQRKLDEENRAEGRQIAGETRGAFNRVQGEALGKNTPLGGSLAPLQGVPAGSAAPLQPGAGAPSVPLSTVYPRIDATGMTPAELDQMDDWQKKDIDLKYQTVIKKYDAQLKGISLTEDQQKRLSQIAASRAWLASWVDLGLNGRNAKDAPEKFPSDLPDTARGLGTSLYEGYVRQPLEQAARNPFYIEMQRIKSIGLPVLARNMGGDNGNLAVTEQAAAKDVQDARAKDEVKNAAYTMDQMLKNREKLILSGKEEEFNAQQRAVNSIPQPQLGGAPPTPQPQPTSAAVAPQAGGVDPDLAAVIARRRRGR